jgi:hypothetical protein
LNVWLTRQREVEYEYNGIKFQSGSQHSTDGHGVLSYKNGWLTSAPCNTREEAIVVANRLIQKHHKDVVIN